MDIRKKTCLIVKKNGEYLAGRIIFSTDLRWSIYRHEAVRTRDIDKAKLLETMGKIQKNQEEELRHHLDKRTPA